MWQYFLNNPSGRRVGDCAIRALSAALNVDWETVYIMIAVQGFVMRDMPSSNAVWGAVLRQNGFERMNIPNTCPDCYTFAEFAKDNPKGVFVIGTGTHVATIKDGVLMDAWDSSREIPAFVWFKKG